MKTINCKLESNCKHSFAASRLTASRCITALLGLLAILHLSTGKARAACAGNIGVAPTWVESRAHVNDVVHIDFVLMTMGDLTCTLSHGTNLLALPDNSKVVATADFDHTLGIANDNIQCPGTLGRGCVAYTQAYQIKPGDVGLPLFVPFPRKTAQAGISQGFASGGVPNRVYVAAAAEADNVTDPENIGVGAGEDFIVILTPCISVTKECVQQCTPIGQPIQVRGVVRNCSTGPNLALSQIHITNTVGGVSVELPPSVFAATTSSGRAFTGSLTNGESVNYSFSYTPPGSPCGPFPDTVTVCATDDATPPLQKTVCASASATCKVQTAPCIDLTKTCASIVDCDPNTPGAQVALGANYTETFTVRNCGDVALRNVTVNDTLNGVVTVINVFAPPANATSTCSGQTQLGPGATCTVVLTRTAPSTPPAGGCFLQDTAFAEGVNICPDAAGNAPCPNPQVVRSANRTCRVDICCPPCIRIVEEVVCVKAGGGCEPFTPEENDQTNACGFRNEDRSQCSAFCFKIKIENRCIDGSIPFAAANNVRVTCSDPRVSLASCNFPTTLQPGEMFMCQVGPITLCDDLVNTVCVTADNVPPDSDDTDSVGVQIRPIAVRCESLFVSSLDTDTLINNCVALPEGSTDVPVRLTTTIFNDGQADLAVTVNNLPPMVDCTDQVTPVVISQPIAIPAGGQYVITGCYLADCANVTFGINVRAQVDTNSPNACNCYYDINGQPIRASVGTNDNCPVCATCVQAPECRTTGGGQLIPGFVDQSCIPVVTQIYPSAGVEKITHGGQLGAPFSQMDCGTVLGNPCIRGQWEHQRHYQGNGNPRDIIDNNFHTVTPKGVYDTLSCACLGCCDPRTGAFIPPVIGPMIHKFALCNPDDHKMCGPQPRPAPANALIWSGIGRVTPTDDISGPRANRSEWVIVRVYIEDRSEPGGGHPDPSFPTEPADIYCFQAWKTGIKTSRKPDFTNVSTAFRMALGEDSCEFLKRLEVYPAPFVRPDGTVLPPLPPGSLPADTVNGATADIRDCGPLYDGNRQIHPATGATCTQ